MADPNRPLWQWSACELAEAIAARKVTAVEAVGSAVARMRATNGKINAVVDDLGDAALREAEAHDKVDERRRSDRTAAWRAGHDQGERGSEGVRDAQRRRRLQGRDRAGRCTRGPKPPSGRGHHHRAHQHAGVLLPRDHGERAARPHLQSLERHRLGRRLLGRRGRGGDDGLWPDRARQRHRRLAPLPGLRLRRGHGEARAGPGAGLQSLGRRRARNAGAGDVRAGRDLPRGPRRTPGHALARRLRPARSLAGVHAVRGAARAAGPSRSPSPGTPSTSPCTPRSPGRSTPRAPRWPPPATTCARSSRRSSRRRPSRARAASSARPRR